MSDGYEGWAEHAPYDRIVGAAAPEQMPGELVAQLVDGGIIAMPIGVSNQELRVCRRDGDRLAPLESVPVRFVPMVRMHRQ